MGMFDSYNPVPLLKCPVCKVALSDWQGKGGSCALFIWQQGIAFPISQNADEYNIDEADRKTFRLPKTFWISTCCEKHWIEAECKTENEIWTMTEIKTVKELQKND